MGRLARVVVPGLAHHVTQRGNHQETVFVDDQDRCVYLATLAEHCQRYGVSLVGWCLMTNHVHFVAVPQRPDSLAKAFGRTHNDYARWKHVRERQVGHLWQNRFFSCPLDAGHTWAALRYVECNPVEARMVEHACDWEWSSARAHVAGRDRAELLEWSSWAACWNHETWRTALDEGVAQAEWVERLRQATRTGRPFGAPGFAEQLEQITERPLAPRKRGRMKGGAAKKMVIA